jgi:hypothetical protein
MASFEIKMKIVSIIIDTIINITSIRVKKIKIKNDKIVIWMFGCLDKKVINAIRRTVMIKLKEVITFKRNDSCQLLFLIKE